MCWYFYLHFDFFLQKLSTHDNRSNNNNIIPTERGNYYIQPQTSPFHFWRLLAYLPNNLERNLVKYLIITNLTFQFCKASINYVTVNVKNPLFCWCFSNSATYSFGISQWWRVCNFSYINGSPLTSSSLLVESSRWTAVCNQILPHRGKINKNNYNFNDKYLLIITNKNINLTKNKIKNKIIEKTIKICFMELCREVFFRYCTIGIAWDQFFVFLSVKYALVILSKSLLPRSTLLWLWGFLGRPWRVLTTGPLRNEFVNDFIDELAPVVRV